MDLKRLEQQFNFITEIDKEKMISRQTYVSNASRKENDAEHAWHLAIMAILLQEYANENIDVLKTVTMLLIHDIVEIDAGDTYAYDEKAKKTQHERETRAAERIYHMLPKDQAEKMYDLWLEFEAMQTAEAKYARTMDHIQPILLNHITNGKAWIEHDVQLSQILERNAKTSEGSVELWNYVKEKFIDFNVKNGHIKDIKKE